MGLLGVLDLVQHGWVENELLQLSLWLPLSACVSKEFAFFFPSNFFPKSTLAERFHLVFPRGKLQISLPLTKPCFQEKPGAALRCVQALRNAVAVFVFAFWAKPGRLPVLSKYRAALMSDCGSQGHACCLCEARWICLGT